MGKVAPAIQDRQSTFNVMQTHFFRLGRMVSGRVPYDARAADHADTVQALARWPWPAFAASTGQGETRAHPAIWTQQAKFADLSNKTMAETVKASAAAKTGDLDKLKAAFRATSGTCQPCHGVFRTRWGDCFGLTKVNASSR
jgi:cytochrome c556